MYSYLLRHLSSPVLVASKCDSLVSPIAELLTLHNIYEIVLNQLFDLVGCKYVQHNGSVNI